MSIVSCIQRINENGKLFCISVFLFSYFVLSIILYDWQDLFYFVVFIIIEVCREVVLVQNDRMTQP